VVSRRTIMVTTWLLAGGCSMVSLICARSARGQGGRPYAGTTTGSSVPFPAFLCRKVRSERKHVQATGSMRARPWPVGSDGKTSPGRIRISYLGEHKKSWMVAAPVVAPAYGATLSPCRSCASTIPSSSLRKPASSHHNRSSRYHAYLLNRL